MHCIDVGTGDILWKKDYLTDFGAEIPIWGFCGSPLLVDDKLIITAAFFSFGRFTPYFVRYACTASRFSAKDASSSSKAMMSDSDAIATTGMP